ncbi:hypothetical protein K474DRAFT_1698827 [Panus rudis PR-1116 ss-1]|nr:hypothetical protein K474DRAFT_1698827 [Panus rudis PR-1116 ss-1]
MYSLTPTREEYDQAVHDLAKLQKENNQLMQEISMLKAENTRLKARVDGSNNVQSTTVEALAIDYSTAAEELRTLREQYNDLVQEKEAEARRFSEHYQKWRRFKKWMMHAKAQWDHSAQSQQAHPEDMPISQNAISSDIAALSSSIRNKESTAQDKRSKGEQYSASIMQHKGNQTLQHLPVSRSAPLWREEVNAQTERVVHQIDNLIPQTPPGYWNIDFPDTQQANAINKQALLRQQAQKKSDRV